MHKLRMTIGVTRWPSRTTAKPTTISTSEAATTVGLETDAAISISNTMTTNLRAKQALTTKLTRPRCSLRWGKISRKALLLEEMGPVHLSTAQVQRHPNNRITFRLRAPQSLKRSNFFLTLMTSFKQMIMKLLQLLLKKCLLQKKEPSMPKKRIRWTKLSWSSRNVTNNQKKVSVMKIISTTR